MYTIYQSKNEFVRDLGGRNSEREKRRIKISIYVENLG
jgi:hypothetical protein